MWFVRTICFEVADVYFHCVFQDLFLLEADTDLWVLRRSEEGKNAVYMRKCK